MYNESVFKNAMETFNKATMIRAISIVITLPLIMLAFLMLNI